MAAIRRLLAQEHPEVLRIERIPNARVGPDVQATAALAASSGATRVGQLRAALQASAGMGVEPEALWALAAEHAYQMDLSWVDTDATGRFQAVFSRGEVAASADGRVLPQMALPPLRRQHWHAYANRALQRVGNQQLMPMLRQFLKERLPDYMLPQAYIWLDALPLTPSGKVDRKALPAPEGGRIDLAEQYVAPRTETERTLAAIWQAVLGIDRVGIHDNFFELGGHSLLATQLTSRINRHLQVKLSVRQVFETSTIAGLAALLELMPAVSDNGAASAIRAIPRGDKTIADLLQEVNRLSEEEQRS